MPSIAEAYSAVASGQARLEKVICHTNVPGDALFQRYNRCPWRVMPHNSTTASTETSSTSNKGSSKKSDKAATSAFSFEDHFDSTINAGEDDRGMELDRGTCAEFRGGGIASGNAVGKQGGKGEGAESSSPERDPSSEVIVDLSTRLVGRQGMVLEVGKDGSMVGVVVF